MPTITPTVQQRVLFANAAESIIEDEGWQAATAWAYAIVAEVPRGFPGSVLVVTATGDVRLDPGTGHIISWHTGDEGAAATVDEQLQQVRRAGWTHLFTLNWSAAEGEAAF